MNSYHDDKFKTRTDDQIMYIRMLLPPQPMEKLRKKLSKIIWTQINDRLTYCGMKKEQNQPVCIEAVISDESRYTFRSHFHVLTGNDKLFARATIFVYPNNKNWMLLYVYKK